MNQKELIQAVNAAKTKEEAIALLQGFAEKEREAFKKRLNKQHLTTSGVGSLLVTGALSLIAAGAAYLLGAVEPELYAQGFGVLGFICSAYLTWVQTKNKSVRLEMYDKLVTPMNEAAAKALLQKYEADA